MDLETFKTLLGLEEVDIYDIQLQSVLDLAGEQETDLLHFLKAMCYLESLNPELAAPINSWQIGGASETYKLDKSQTFCERYDLEAFPDESFGVACGARAGQE